MPCNLNVTVIPIVISALRTISRGLLQGLEDLDIRGRAETIQTTALLRSANITRTVLGLNETFCLSDSNERPLADACVKNSHKSISLFI